jgi:molecular chaperone DnaK
MAADNKLLGNFNLEGVALAPRGIPQIEVTFDIDANGIVNVSAKDKGTGKEQQITIQASGGLSDADIEKMVKDAEANKEEDKKKREQVETRNQADTLVHSTEKTLKEHGDKLSAEDKKKIEDDIVSLKASLSTDDLDKAKEDIKSLSESAMKLGEAVYKSQQESQPQQQEKTENDNVVDADYEEVDKK